MSQFDFSVHPPCSLCLCGYRFFATLLPQRHREHGGCTEKKRKLDTTGNFLTVGLDGVSNALTIHDLPVGHEQIGEAIRGGRITPGKQRNQLVATGRQLL